jgi:predicted PurR-regulated permease PerM
MIGAMNDTSVAPWKISTQFVFGLGLTTLFFYMMAPFLVAILLGAVIAIIAYPAYEFAKRKMPKSLAALATSATLAVGLLLPLVFILYSLSFKVLGLISQIRISNSGRPFQTLWEHPWTNSALRLVRRFTPTDADWIKDQALSIFQNVLEKVSVAIGSFFAGMPSLLLSFFVTIVCLFFFLTDGDRFLRFLASLSPLSNERSKELYSTFHKSCRGVVLGLFISAMVQGILLTLLFLITGLPNPLLIGVITAVMAMIPVVGSAPLWIGATIYLMSSGSLGLGVVMLVGGVVTAVSDNIVRPWVMRGQSEMHPLLALVSVFGAVNLLGPTGIFLGPIIAAIFVSFLKILSLELRREKRITH